MFLRTRRLERLRARLRAEWGQRRLARQVTTADAEYHTDIAGSDQTSAAEERLVRDLQLDEVLRAIDRTISPLGRQMLYHRLRSEPDPEAAAELEALIRTFSSRVETRETAQLALRQIEAARCTSVWRLCRPDGVPRRGWHVLFPVLAAGTVIALLLLPLWHPTFLVLLGLLVASIAARAVTSWQTAAVLQPFANLGPILDAADALTTLDGMPEKGSAGIRNDLDSLMRLRRIVRWAARDPMSQGELAGVAQEYLNMLFLLDANAMYFGGRLLRDRGKALRRVLEWVGMLDLAQSIASLRAEPEGWCLPMGGGSAIELTDVRHPLLEDAVPNSVTIVAGTGIIVTGANMSGKTTFLRTVGVAALLARTLNSSPSRSYRGPVVRVHTCIQVVDSLLEGKSYYLAEAEAAVAMLRAARQPSPQLFVVDELFRGTNSVERIAAGEAVLRWLAGDGGAAQYVMAATHDGELVELLADCYEAVHFEEEVANDRLRFDYRLRPGRATTRSALRLLGLLGAPEEVLAAAAERTEVLDRAAER
jgi:hypothetical protein